MKRLLIVFAGQTGGIGLYMGLTAAGLPQAIAIILAATVAALVVTVVIRILDFTQ